MSARNIVFLAPSSIECAPQFARLLAPGEGKEGLGAEGVTVQSKHIEKLLSSELLLHRLLSLSTVDGQAARKFELLSLMPLSLVKRGTANKSVSHHFPSLGPSPASILPLIFTHAVEPRGETI
jgi:hypothetical protein